ncbi:MAG: bifunctional pyr operon transcriptional regulator/uracil phosphoribosyltransferase PyrR [Candidatus Hydrogenedentota bacterium]
MTDESTESTVIMDAEEMDAALASLSTAILDAHQDEDSICLLGILSRGRPLADRLAQRLTSQGAIVHIGSLSTTLYRDDLRSGKVTPKIGGSETHFDFDVDGRSIVLVDDVLNSGRTIRAALDEVMDYGRPSRIHLACLIDRGLREVPIQADYLGKSIQTESTDHVQVRLQEIDGEDSVVLTRKG